MQGRRRWLRINVSLRDLLLLMLITFSILSFYISYNVGSGNDSTEPSWKGKRLRSQKSIVLRKMDSKPTDASFPSEELKKLLKEIEHRQLEETLRSGERWALVRGQGSVINRDLPLYARTLEEQGWTIRVQRSLAGSAAFPLERNGTMFYERRDDPRLENDEWLLLLCLAFTDGDKGECLTQDDYFQLKPFQKVNKIPGMRNVLWRKDSLCRTLSRVRSVLSNDVSYPSTLGMPSCYPMPDQYEEFLNAADGQDISSWILKSAIPGGRVELLSNEEVFRRVRLKQFYLSEDSLIQEYVPNPLKVFGHSVSVQIYVLVTSILPLRAYVYKDGVVYFRRNETKGFKKISGKTWLASQLWQALSEQKGSEAVQDAMERTDSLLLSLLLLMETLLPDASPVLAAQTPYRCEHCFQLLSVDVMFNATLHPFLMEVTGQPNMQESMVPETFAIDSLKRRILRDMSRMLYSRDATSTDVHSALVHTANNDVGIIGLSCYLTHDICLTNEDLKYFITSRRELINAGEFKRLYPTTQGDKFASLVEQMQLKMMRLPLYKYSHDGWVLKDKYRHSTVELHDIFTSVESYFNRVDATVATNEEEDDYPFLTADDGRFQMRNMQYNGRKDDRGQNINKKECVTEGSVTGYLQNLTIEPAIELRPAFSPLWTEYQAEVPYDVAMVRLGGVSNHCGVHIRLDGKYGADTPVNVTLGLGTTRLSLLVVTTSTPSPWVLATYALTIRRRHLSAGEPPFTPNTPHHVCGLRQECDLRVSPRESCGVQEESVDDWPSMLREVEALPICQRGDAEGRWILPCGRCGDRFSCFWRESRWQPYRCRYRDVSREALASCLAGKKLIFIGDSTNRGMMHYLVEQLNGTLTDGQKTHDLKVYPNLNNGRTFVAFAYYPQFWLPSNERPVFDKTFYQLILKSLPLENNTNTVIVIGGVHWLATQHLHMVMKALRSEGLQGAKVVMKTLGSGFHIPAEGVHYLTKEDQEKILLRSVGLAAFAHHHSLEVVDTFNITVARHKDFLQGKCACHFHKIIEAGEALKESSLMLRIPSTHASSAVRVYHVEGEINAVYTKILISRLCDDFLMDNG